ncbi:MAG TPA: 1-deoxy-D-xylulose-5-phosphate synthase [Candidatus Polarisedimenticolia bacterium]|jgi:1-deoxy-D-xylulose-5-phosphate synthase|nr:1-deoxy-D-xylulose-5-phosphate synthase [Candidatus Polarisedimenticolia bacterium]
MMKENRFLDEGLTPARLKGLTLPELEELAREIRQAICEQVARGGGHLAPNLGVVELTLALHYVFDFGTDRLLFDVGHQCYTHKLLTGRLPLLGRLRQKGGMSGFPEPLESPYDLFSVGHAGTGVSTGIGMARGDLHRGEAHRKVVVLVGDAAIVNGVSMEGLNNAGTLRRQFLVVLNDNGMSIGKPQGALAGYFDRIRVNPRFTDLKDRAREVLKHVPVAQKLEEIYHRLGEVTKAALEHTHLFDHFGMLCIGPMDGHELGPLVEVLREVREIERPVLLHVKTIKGKGFDFSSDDPVTFHSPSPFQVTGCRAEIHKDGRSFTAAFGDAMIDLMERDPGVIAVTAGMADGTGLAKVMPRFPARTFDVGIAESHAVDMCAGMAKTGLRPFAAIYSTFLQRAFDQVFQEVALQGLPVRFCLDRAGLVGGDGAVHHGFLDVAFLRGLPGMVLLAARDEPTLRAALEFMRLYDAGPSAVRYPREKVPEPAAGPVPPFELGKAHLLAEGSDLAVFAYGFPANTALAARSELEKLGHSIAVYDARFAKPVDRERLRALVESGIPILTVEDHHVAGGFGSCVLEACHEMGLPTQGVVRLGLPDRWIYHGSRREQQEEAGIDTAALVRQARAILEKVTAARRLVAADPPEASGSSVQPAAAAPDPAAPAAALEKGDPPEPVTVPAPRKKSALRLGGFFRS